MQQRNIIHNNLYSNFHPDPKLHPNTKRLMWQCKVLNLQRLHILDQRRFG